MNILLTNDDGFDFEGIRLVKRKLDKFARVIIVAPKGPMSAKSISKTFGVSMHLKEEEKDIYSFEGTPADCVAFALTSMDIKFDLVVSGCNNGYNACNDILYSGTVGACIEALTYGVPAIAVSCEKNFDIVDKYFDETWKFIIEKELINKEYVVNVNFPLGEVVNDIKLCKVYYRKDNNFFTKADDGGYLAGRDIELTTDDKETDWYMINNSITSISLLNRHFFYNNLYEEYKNKINK